MANHWLAGLWFWLWLRLLLCSLNLGVQTSRCRRILGNAVLRPDGTSNLDTTSEVVNVNTHPAVCRISRLFEKVHIEIRALAPGQARPRAQAHTHPSGSSFSPGFSRALPPSERYFSAGQRPSRDVSRAGASDSRRNSFCRGYFPTLRPSRDKTYSSASRQGVRRL